MPGKQCPNCGGGKFYLETADGGLMFFWVDQAGRLLATQPPREDVTPSPLPQTVHCISCAWHGGLDELAPAQ